MLASFTVVAAGLRAAADLLVPFVLGVFLAVASTPLLRWLRQRRVRQAGAVALTALVDLALFGALLVVVTLSSGQLDRRLPRYLSLLRGHHSRWMAELESRGVPASTHLSLDALDPAWIAAIAGEAVQALASLIAGSMVVAVIAVFVLAEATTFPRKFGAITGPGPGAARLAHIAREVQTYLGLKFVISLATGVCVTLLCQLTLVDFPVLLGLIAFVLNFVPTVGSILASAPGIALALILHGEGAALGVALGYLGINTVIGNIVDPQIMGERMRLSTLVVVLSLLFWGFIWGPVGALLSVPLTMVAKIAFQNVPDLRWVAVLLDKGPPRELAVR